MECAIERQMNGQDLRRCHRGSQMDRLRQGYRAAVVAREGFEDLVVEADLTVGHSLEGRPGSMWG